MHLTQFWLVYLKFSLVKMLDKQNKGSFAVEAKKPSSTFHFPVGARTLFLLFFFCLYDPARQQSTINSILHDEVITLRS